MKTYGIELETSSLSIRAAQSALDAVNLSWSAKFDGTRGVDAEAVSPILDDGSLSESITAARALLRAGATVNRQTGFHVHLGAAHYGNDGIAALVRNWYTAADAIGALVAPSRLNNHFCTHAVPVNYLDDWAESIRNGNLDNSPVRNLQSYARRYFSLNLESYAKHGTVEFRLHHGTLNGKKIQAWAEFCEALATFSTAGGILDGGTGNRLNDINKILGKLVINESIKLDTASYLKQRAIELSA
tara:strand:- start:624 stop:1355 length:732 start_codon:yes stop_codon:yes gene_type:complete